MKLLMIDVNETRISKIKEFLNVEDSLKVCDSYVSVMKELKTKMYDLLILAMDFPLIKNEKVYHKAGVSVLRALELTDIDTPIIVYSSDEYKNLSYANVISCRNCDSNPELLNDINGVRAIMENRKKQIK